MCFEILYSYIPVLFDPQGWIIREYLFRIPSDLNYFENRFTPRGNGCVFDYCGKVENWLFRS